MSISPRSEDFERLAIRWTATSHVGEGYPNAIAAMAAFPELFVRQRDSLPQNDTDRAFACMGKACEILDVKVLYAADEAQVQRLTDEAAALLEEAVKLDPQCFDALRIRHMMSHGVRDAMVTYLSQEADHVLEECLRVSASIGLPVTEGNYSASVYMRPYLRWLLNLANEQLNCGRYHRSLDICERLLQLDKVDIVGARLVMAYDYVKLEDEAGFDALVARFSGETNAWFLLGKCFLAFKARRIEEARSLLHDIVITYPSAGRTLYYQEEIPLGTFGHLEYAPLTADELFIAISEAAVILDENCNDGLSTLSGWIAADPMVVQAKDAEEKQMGQDGGQAPSPEGRVNGR